MNGEGALRVCVGGMKFGKQENPEKKRNTETREPQMSFLRYLGSLFINLTQVRHF